jgi:hypothetical protein
MTNSAAPTRNFSNLYLTPKLHLVIELKDEFEFLDLQL